MFGCCVKPKNQHTYFFPKPTLVYNLPNSPNVFGDHRSKFSSRFRRTRIETRTTVSALFSTMAKMVVSSLGVHKKNPMKRTKKKRLLEKVVDYLKSDSYLFAPLLSSSPTKTISATQSGIEIKKPFEEENKNLLIKVGEYLKSDCYMYAPLIVPQPAFSTATISVSHLRRGAFQLL
ncbi:unnamed protein product [Ilex paraguariensis]|uniref:Uncharacterized protein n=1 Tax=Ilex paraguariensis TaxID=185542 RepID=A0ABC8R821_9AQUA